MKKRMPAGGKREGAGRPKADRETVVVSFRVDKEYYEKAKETHVRGLNKKVNDLIKRLSKSPKKPT